LGDDGWVHGRPITSRTRVAIADARHPSSLRTRLSSEAPARNPACRPAIPHIRRLQAFGNHISRLHFCARMLYFAQIGSRLRQGAAGKAATMSNARKILIVDDDDELRDALTE